MAAELASGYVSLTVKLAKGGMADVTKEVKKAGTEGGKVYSDEFNKKVETEVGKKLPDVIGKSTKSSGSGGIAQAAKEAAAEFGKGVLTGIEQELKRSGGVEGALGTINSKVKETTGLIEKIGGATGIDTTGITTAAGQITDAIGGINTTVGSTKEALKDFKTGDYGGGLTAIADALKGLESVGLPPGFATEIGEVSSKFSETQKSVNDVTTALEGLPLGKLSKILPFADEIVAAGQALGDALKPALDRLDRDMGLAREEGEGFADWWHRFALGLSREEAELRLKPLNLQPTKEQLDQFFGSYQPAITNPVAVAPGQAPPGGPQNPLLLPYAPPRTSTGGRPGGRAKGGAISGPGGVDNVPAWLTAGEGVITKAAMQNGGATIMALLNANKGIPGFASGGAVNAGIAFAASLSGLPYSYGGVGPGAFDCSGAQSAVFAAFTGKPQGTRYFTTESNFEALGFQKGYMPGAYNIGVSRGGGGKLSHMGATLPNGVTFEAGGANRGVMYGDGARGASSFPLQWYLPLAGGDPSGGGGGGAGAGAGGAGGGGGGGGGLGPSGTFQPGSNPYAQQEMVNRQRAVAGADQAALDKQQAEAIKGMLPDFGALADIGIAGLKENMPPGFFDYTSGKTAASLGALMKSIGILSGNPQVASIMGGVGAGITGSGSGLYSGIMGAIPAPVGTLAPGQLGAPELVAANSGGGAGVNIGTINGDPQGVIDNATKTASFNAQNQSTTIKRSFV